jgi:hypothetical protein
MTISLIAGPVSSQEFGTRVRLSLLAAQFLFMVPGLLFFAQSLAFGAQALAEVPPSCQVSPQYVKLSQCIAKDNSVVIGGSGGTGSCSGANVTAYVDQSGLELGRITINSGSALKLLDETAQSQPGSVLTLQTSGIQDLGSLEIGNGTCPIGEIKPATRVVITFTGLKTSCGSDGCAGYVKGIEVGGGGTLRMYGLKGVPPNGISWTHLSRPAGDSATYSSANGVAAPANDAANVIYTTDDVGSGSGAWRPGDWLVVATTSFSSWESEFVRIASPVEANADPKKLGASKITLEQPLKFYHFGGADPGDPSTKPNYNAGAALNYGVDERAEVGLISRNIVLTSDADSSPDNLHWGGELRFLHGFTAVSLQGVELQKFGKEALGSDPIHFHMDGELNGKSPTDVLVDSNSIDHSYNKCITIHSTQSLTISNNVCARITGHIFYEEVGDEYNIAFKHNLGIGAMSNSFDIHTTTESDRDTLISKYYWPGDNLFTPISFNQFNIFNTDGQDNPTRGTCGSVDANGKILLNRPIDEKHPKCDPSLGDVWFEPPAGFWLVNPSTKLTGNAIAGCQDNGKAYWYVPPTVAVGGFDVKFIPIGSRYSSYGPERHGTFENNSGHGCYSGVYGEDDGVVSSGQLFGYENGIHDKLHQPVVDEFDGLTLSRIRDRGVWLRPTFFVLKDARVATSRDGVSLVTSGGVDGNYPGVWGLLEHSVIVGISTNNVDRWGPCGAKIPAKGAQVRGAQYGCIDQTVPKSPPPVIGGAFTDRGYATPDWPMFGFLIYDGPPLLINDRFVNFRVAPGTRATANFTAAKLLTAQDDKILNEWIFYGIPACPLPFPPAYTNYEGDAALGWFNANQSSYPAATTTEKLTFTNVDLRHQIYTAAVNRAEFTDGDENTTILDNDGTLSGLSALEPNDTPLPSISLNNLGINASANSVDECLSGGAEDLLREGRPTSAMVPSALGQLEFEQLYPPIPPDPDKNDPLGKKHTELLTFSKNTRDFDALDNVAHHSSMPLKSRNGLGDWEPKVTSGYGYTVTASNYADPGLLCKEFPESEGFYRPGISSIVDLTLTDIVNAPDISPDHPFYVQLGICFTDQDGSHPDDKFTVTRGFRSYGGGEVVPNDKLAPYWGGPLKCHLLDSQMATAAKKPNVMPPDCPAASATGSPVVPLNEVTPFSISKLTKDGKLNGPPFLNKYTYDKTNGWLFLWVAQTEPNGKPSAKGPSPLGNCTGADTDPAFCPSKTTGDSYYVCPAQGCPTYRIVLNDPNYKPGPSQCGDPYSAEEGYEWPGPPPNENALVLAGTKEAVMQTAQGGKGNKFPHYTTSSPVVCPVNP